jgi:dephospho-CoA kinase
MEIIGLTGGIASGKSTVASILKKFGVPIVDADILARKVVEKGEPALDEIVKVFGIEILNYDGSLNRKKLGEIIFNNKEKRNQLNKIVHPEINKLREKKFQRYREKGEKRILYDCPLLIEENLFSLVDKVWLVYVNKEIQIKRLMERDGYTRNQALKRVESQMSIEKKRQYADLIINNEGSTVELEEKLKKLWFNLE